VVELIEFVKYLQLTSLPMLKYACFCCVQLVLINLRHSGETGWL